MSLGFIWGLGVAVVKVVLKVATGTNQLSTDKFGTDHLGTDQPGTKEAMIGIKTTFGDEHEGGDEGYQPQGETVSSVPASCKVVPAFCRKDFRTNCKQQEIKRMVRRCSRFVFVLVAILAICAIYVRHRFGYQPHGCIGYVSSTPAYVTYVRTYVRTYIRDVRRCG